MNRRENRDSEVGNTISTSSNCKKQSNQLKKWCFTFNNYEDTDIERLESIFREICVKYVFQPEVGENGTPHLQGGIWLKKAMRWSQFKLPNTIHWEKMRNEEATIAYCKKTKTSVGPPKVWGFPKPIKIIEQLRPWQLTIELIATGEPDGRTVHWIYDEIGAHGKSAFCKYMYITYGTMVIQGGRLADIVNIVFNQDMDCVTTIIIDVPRKNGSKISYSAVECILNGMITNTKYETGTKVFNPPNVIIFSNSKPEVRHFSEDRWDIRELKNGKLSKVTVDSIKYNPIVGFEDEED